MTLYYTVDPSYSLAVGDWFRIDYEVLSDTIMNETFTNIAYISGEYRINPDDESPKVFDEPTNAVAVYNNHPNIKGSITKYLYSNQAEEKLPIQQVFTGTTDLYFEIRIESQSDIAISDPDLWVGIPVGITAGTISIVNKDNEEIARSEERRVGKEC